MAATIVHEEAISTELDGEEVHILELLCTTAGDLPDKYIFVREIVDPANASADVFTRVVNTADIEEMSSNRATAIVNGADYWRSDYMRKTFSNLGVAVQAKSDIDDYIHQLTQDWDTYSNDFKDDSDHDFPYPVGYKTNVEGLTDTFYAAYDTYLAVKEAETDAQTALTAAQALIAAGSPAVLRKDFAASIATGLSTLQSEAIAVESRFDILVGNSDAASNCQWFIAQVDAYLAGIPSVPLQAARDAFLARVLDENSTGGAEFNNSTADHGVKKAEADAEATAATSAYNTLAGAAATAQSTLTSATQAKTDAWAALMTDPDSAYAELVACCPDFQVSHGYSFPPTP